MIQPPLITFGKRIRLSKTNSFKKAQQRLVSRVGLSINPNTEFCGIIEGKRSAVRDADNIQRQYANGVAHMDSIPQKRCDNCGEPKPATSEYFHRHKNYSDGLRPTCKICRKVETKTYYESNKLQVLKANADWRDRNSEKMKEYQDKYVLAHPEKVTASKKQYEETHKEVLYIRTKIARETHPEQYAARKAVQIAVKRGELTAIALCKCNRCENMARHYHHWSYEPEHWLDVEPLCIKCHQKEHAK